MIIITGGAGFIGSALLTHLNEGGHQDIIIVDNLRDSQKWKNLVGKVFSDYWSREKLIQEIRSKSLPEKLKSIIHLGACSSTLETNVDYLMENNYRYSIELAQFCTANRKRFIYASSAATYGDGSSGFSDKGDINNLKPLNPYGFSKQLFDLWALKNGILDHAVGLKFFNVFGPNEYHKGSMQSMVLKGYKQILDSGKIRLFKSASAEFCDGGQMRDFIYVKDCCNVIAWLLENPNISGLFNLGSGVARSWNDLAKAIFNAAGIENKIEYIDMPAELARQYQNFTQADVQKLKEAGYKTEFMSLEEAISDYVIHYLAKESKIF